MTFLEAAAALLSIAYLLLAMRENIACWYAGFASNAIFLAVFWNAGLPMAAALQCYYMGIAIYGWHHWRRGGATPHGGKTPPPKENAPPPPPSFPRLSPSSSGESSAPIGASSGTGSNTTTPPVRRWPWHRHAAALAAVLLLSALSGCLLERYTNAAFPYADSFTTWGAALTSWMVARKLLENWLYWIVIDAISIALYLMRDLHITAALFCAYALIAIFGFRQWLSRYRRQSSQYRR